MNKISSVLIFMSLVLTGCMTTTTYRNSHGNLEHIVSCNGSIRNMGHCKNEAYKICNGPFIQISANEAYESIHKIGNSIVLGQSRQLTFQCK